MRKYLLKEGELPDVTVAIQKSLSMAPLSVNEVIQLGNTLYGDLVVEYGLSQSQADSVTAWLKNEVLRLNNEAVVNGPIEGYDVRYRRPGSPGLFESSKAAHTHYLNDHSKEMARCWAHGQVVDPNGYTDMVHRGIEFSKGASKSPLRLSESTLRKIIREAILRKDS